ncbi:MAG: hypothetical protein J6B17_01970 [Ruminococcus sp.]|nr:hypothetical protein [Ruminococcus sp.]
MKDYEQVTRDVFRKRDIYLEKRRKRIAYIEKGVSIMSIAGILVVLGLCTSMSSSIAPALQDEPNEIDINSGISTVTSQTAQTEQTARTIQDSTAVLTSTGLTSKSAEKTSKTSAAITANTASSAEAALTAVRNVLTSDAENTSILTSAVSGSSESGTLISSDTSETTASTSETSTSATESTSSTESVDSTVEDDGIFSFAYRLCENGSREQTIYIDKAELEKGDYTINTAIYIETEDSPSGLISADAGWFGFDNNGDRTKYITFDNCSAYSEENDLVTTDAMYAAIKDSDIIDGVNINSSFAPSCFTTIRERSSGTTLKHWPSAPRYTYSTISVSNPGNYPNGDYTLYSAGPYKVYFTRDYDGKTYYVDLEYDEKSGTATGVCEELEAGAAYGPANVRIHHYDPETPVDEPIIKSFTHACLIDISAPTEEWFGGASDYLPFVTFDSIIDQDTPAGTYYVGFTPTNIVGSEMNAMCCKTSMELLLAENVDKEHNDQSYWLKIVVGDSAETEDDTAYDVNLDGTIGVDDATEVLSIYAEAAAGTNSDIQIQQAANVNADVDGDGAVTLSDATAILTRYAEKASGLE